MPDLVQEMADVQAAIGKMQEQAQAQATAAAPPAAGKVRLRHPLSGDVKDVDATPSGMVPLMARGYQQVKE
jgi:hypothetical protein